MKLNEDLGELSPRGKAVLFGAMALCCVVPMLVVAGALSISGALFGGTAAVVVGAVGIVGWVGWMARRQRHNHAPGGACCDERHDDRAASDHGGHAGGTKLAD